MKIPVSLVLMIIFTLSLCVSLSAEDRFEIATIENSWTIEFVGVCQNPGTGDLLVYFQREIYNQENTIYTIVLKLKTDNSFEIGETTTLVSVKENIDEVHCVYSESAGSFLITWRENSSGQQIYKAMALSASGKGLSKPAWIFNSTSSKISKTIPVGIQKNNKAAPAGSMYALVCYVDYDGNLSEECAIYYLNSKLSKIGKPARIFRSLFWNGSTLANAHASSDGGFLVYLLDSLNDESDNPNIPKVVKTNGAGVQQKVLTLTPDEVWDDHICITQMKSGNYYAMWREDYGHGLWSRVIKPDGTTIGDPKLSSKKETDLFESVTTDNGVTYLLLYGDEHNYKDRNFYTAKVRKTGKSTKMNIHPYTQYVYYNSGEGWYCAAPIKGTKSYLLITLERDDILYGNVYP